VADPGERGEAFPPLRRHEPADRGGPARVAHHDRRADHAAAREPDTGGAAVFHEHLLDLGGHRDVAARVLDDRQDGGGDAARPADGVGGTVQVVLGHERVVPEAGEARGEPVVAVLPGENRAEEGILHVGGDHLAGGPPCVAEEPAAHEAAEQGGHAGGDGLGREVGARRPGAALHLVEVAPDSPVLGGEGRGEPLHEPLRPRRELELPVAHDDPVVDVRQRGPVEPSAGDVVEDAAQRAPAPGHLADVVDPHVPLEALPFEGVGESAGGGVALQHEDAHPAPPRQHRSHPQAADARADDDRVEGTLDRALLPGRSDARCQVRLPPAAY
jgi:hypothetical protein